jgi:carbon-monoxide dehydrogenase large subunit
MDATGRVTLSLGTQSSGQGHETAYAQVAADRLGIDLDRIRIVQGDTDLIAKGGGTGGSRSLPIGGVACERALEDLMEKALRLAGTVLQADGAKVQWRHGAFEAGDTNRRIDLATLAACAWDPAYLKPGEAPGLQGRGEFTPLAPTFPNGCHVCEVEIDPATGQVRVVRYTSVDDCGTVLNPLLLAGQLQGGIVQGIGQALLEQCVYDQESGRLLSGSFVDYGILRAADLPPLDLHFTEEAPCRTNPLGLKGAGEVGAIAAPPAVINAVVDALAEYGIVHIDMPATPEKIWQALRQQGGVRIRTGG